MRTNFDMKFPISNIPKEQYNHSTHDRCYYKKVLNSSIAYAVQFLFLEVRSGIQQMIKTMFKYLFYTIADLVSKETVCASMGK